MSRSYAPINKVSQIHGERIRTTRRGLGLTQRDLANMFGVARATITQIENGHFDITRSYPKYKIFHERLRIWAESNRGGRKKKYVNSTAGFIRHDRKPEPKPLLPYVAAWARYWAAKRNPQNPKGDQNGRENTQ